LLRPCGQLDVKQASIASEEELKSLDLRKGAVCPVSNRLWDMPQLISKEVFELDYVSTNARKRWIGLGRLLVKGSEMVV